jgi:DNA invertase Pin-like site-specific DNA recombinase
MAVWTPANREKRHATRRFTPDHRAKIAAGVKAARHAATEAGISFGRKRKLTDAQLGEIIERRKAGEELAAIAKDYAVSKATIFRIVKTT